MCQRNWPEYNANLVQRGSLTFFCHPSVVRSLRKVQKSPTPSGGRPPYNPQVILLIIMLKITYKLSYRSCQGMATSILAPLAVSVPSYSTICRSMVKLVNFLPKLTRRRTKTYLIDSSGFKVFGEGEWKTKIHGQSYRRSWVKVHLMVDSDTNEIVDLVLTPPSEADVNVGLRFLQSIKGKGKMIMADGAYDSRRFRRQAYNNGVEALVPPPRGAKLQEAEFLKGRNAAIRIIEMLGGDLVARRLWGRISGYSNRAKVEGAFSRLKRLFGVKLFSREFTAQTVEVWIKALLSNIWLREVKI